MNNQLLKEKLQATIKKNQSKNDGSPITNLKLDQTLVAEIEQLTRELESLNPHPQPLLYATALLEGAWQLQYSTAREIRSLDSLPLGLQIGKVYQVINIADKLFFNVAQVQHPLGLISGYVKVTASFEPAIDTSNLADKRINVYFDKRYLAIEKIVGINTPKLNPFKVIVANNPQGRIATLDITYLDETLRIGRGGDESLFILNKVNDLPNLAC
ncbi:PAP/fibrillin family protein [Dolichospermum sp. ST_con]|nr:PAP/fibrillin family protein [Dolichospermum sp. ST_con]MDD1420842.1 PAP/fibrillin family protein [Dolichospermum sp. ST_sed1]MDD1423044.1 PAP/fibrillin family protein [Dolichospermum sp. ST_sed9]MDD1432480.1 PAP/fibrillin family protein [Dolichospermum sp. ST_sed6]MDD1436313.1 PAP/fibrillin family protein [Dolichospermum sp. ST_sed10]MDD1442400.1 PAP/fibrillin family protein [Dolichospermum sp. ST_sed3]MDD1447841.1 PAP/fibrillin family protein [Dolichospermum sp. ST_sed8]MDD1453458.1 PAP